VRSNQSSESHTIIAVFKNSVRNGRSSTTDGAKRRKWSILEPGHRSQSLEPFQFGTLGAGTVERLQLGHGLTAVSDHKRLALAHLLQVPAEPGFEFAGTDRRMSWHVVMMTTLTAVVNCAGTGVPGTWRNQMEQSSFRARADPAQFVKEVENELDAALLSAAFGLADRCQREPIAVRVQVEAPLYPRGETRLRPRLRFPCLAAACK
jgi:hypothetical protein